jgi:hypothetical protein
MTLHICRACDGETSLVLDLGRTAPSHRFLNSAMAHDPEPTGPLRLVRCENCGLLQLDELLPVDSTSELTAQPADVAVLAQQIVERYGLERSDLVLEIGDESYLRAFRPFGVRTKSVMAPEHLHRHPPGSARIVLGRKALCRTDLPTLLHGVAHLLSPDGIAIFEVPHVLPLFERLAYDDICHETRCFFSVEGLCMLMARHGLELIDAVPMKNDSGYVRVTVQREGGPIFSRTAVEKIVAKEQSAGLNRPDAWADFAQLVEQSRDLLTSEIEDWLYRGKRVAAWTRNGRGMTLLAYCGLDSRRLTCVIDENPDLHGRLTPGHRIPIVSPECLKRDHPDLILWLGGEWDPEHGGPLADHWQRGGRVLLPLPKPHYADPAHLRRTIDTIVPGLSFSDFA